MDTASARPFDHRDAGNASRLVFTGFTDRRFKAFDDATGKELWSTRLGDTPSGAPISYSVNGRQYVAIISGCCSYQTRDVQAYVPDVKLPPDHGAVIWVFQLPGGRN